MTSSQYKVIRADSDALILYINLPSDDADLQRLIAKQTIELAAGDLGWERFVLEDCKFHMKFALAKIIRRWDGFGVPVNRTSRQVVSYSALKDPLHWLEMPVEPKLESMIGGAVSSTNQPALSELKPKTLPEYTDEMEKLKKLLDNLNTATQQSAQAIKSDAKPQPQPAFQPEPDIPNEPGKRIIIFA